MLYGRTSALEFREGQLRVRLKDLQMELLKAGWREGEDKERATNALVEGGFVKLAKSSDLIKDGFLLKTGKAKIKESGNILPEDKEWRTKKLRSLVRDGVLSPEDFSAMFINLRDVMGMTDIEARNTIGQLYVRQVKDSGVKPEVVGGVPYGALWPAMQVAHGLGLPMITQRKEGDMVHARMVGNPDRIHNGKQAIIVEDIFTTGGSAIEFAGDLRDNGMQVENVYAFLDRNQGAEQNMAKHNLKKHSVIDMDYLKHVIQKNPNINKDVKDLIM
jgi:orotate phosphoribosyltransferase